MHFPFVGDFPNARLRRIRQFSWVRDIVAQNFLQTSDLIHAIFVRPPELPAHIPSLPGMIRYTPDEIPTIIERLENLQIPAVAMFPIIPEKFKNDLGSYAIDPHNLMCQAIRVAKETRKNIGIIADVALDPYTSHGHDGVLVDGIIANDASIEMLREQALVLAKAGADIIAPSDMMDGRIKAIRHILDQNDLANILIMSYAAKFASSFYGPFREAVGASTLQGQTNKRTYQLDFRNADQALQEISQDIQEGADLFIVKPGMPYLDIMKQASDTFNVPMVAFQVSGEYAMLKAASQNNGLSYTNCMMEIMYAFKRAGARAIITYAAEEIALCLHQTNI